MFRKMRRFKQELSLQECEEILQSEPRGVLSVLGDDGYPYGMPLNHWYDSASGKLYFHGAKSGHKIDSIRFCDKVSYCVYDKGFRRDGEWALNIRSVVVFGRIRIIEDRYESMRICSQICRKFTDDEDYLEHELAHSGNAVLCLELMHDHITGKMVNES